MWLSAEIPCSMRPPCIYHVWTIQGEEPRGARNHRYPIVYGEIFNAAAPEFAHSLSDFVGFPCHLRFFAGVRLVGPAPEAPLALMPALGLTV
jgi:hypothetical protein